MEDGGAVVARPSVSTAMFGKVLDTILVPKLCIDRIGIKSSKDMALKNLPNL